MAAGYSASLSGQVIIADRGYDMGGQGVLFPGEHRLSFF